MRIWEYIHVNKEEHTIKDGFPYKEPILISEDQPDSDYVELKTVQEIYDLGESFFMDYQQYRSKIIENVNFRDWEDLTDKEKDIVISLDIYKDGIDPSVWSSIKAQYIAYKGENPLAVLHSAFAEHHVKDVRSCDFRIKHENLYKIVPKYLSLDNATTFFKLVQNLFTQYQVQGIKGTKDGVVGIGLFDFFESTPGTIYEFTGLESQNFTINTPYSLQDFIDELMLWFRKGEYYES